MKKVSGNGAGYGVEMWYWKEFEKGGKYRVGLIDILASEWTEIGSLQTAVVDDFGTLVEVPR